ncbi:hypothetical protein BpHYR1_010921 [Brachionus plicatilis]|uniref:Uncharacterized protein n=1 Tax=Brachionus plicatilis TaxID=10195 RepID=A0A3M7SC75_BRAPC|nr:hypothetical protein BpHYR1_010921 [Brachionus plicatilis]
MEMIMFFSIIEFLNAIILFRVSITCCVFFSHLLMVAKTSPGGVNFLARFSIRDNSLSSAMFELSDRCF